MGKSVLADQCRMIGIPVHDADACVHKLMQPDGAAFFAVAEKFPEAVEAGQINRKALGRIVFNNLEKRKILERIIHPLVRREAKKFIRLCEKQRHKICVLDIPLLFETGRYRQVDKIICVSAPRYVQKRRVLARPGMSEEKFNAIVKTQMPDYRKRIKSDYVIISARGRRHTLARLRQIKNILEQGH